MNGAQLRHEAHSCLRRLHRLHPFFIKHMRSSQVGSERLVLTVADKFLTISYKLMESKFTVELNLNQPLKKRVGCSGLSLLSHWARVCTSNVR